MGSCRHLRLCPLLLASGLLLGALLGGGPAVSDAAEPKDKAKVQKAFNDLYPVTFRAAVNAALEKGCRWLLASQRGDGSFNFFTHHRAYPLGSSALATLTLLKCGIPRDHPKIVKAFAYLRKLPLRRVYSASVLLMALDAKYAPARDPFAVENIDRYGLRVGKDPCRQEITPDDLAWMKEAVAFLLEHQRANGTWRYPDGGFDLSNTQFALLGLHAATRCGAKVKQAVWLDALRFCLDFQEKEGEAVMYKANEVRGRYRFEWTERALSRGFRYGLNSARPTASMTTAGLTCLVVCQNRLWRTRGFSGQLRADTRRGVRDAMAWLQQNFSPSSNPAGDSAWTFYYLYGLERAGVLGRYRFLGTHDWYKEGAEFLLTRQHGAGYWITHHHWEGSCFALLFLKRATSRMRAPVFTPRGGEDGQMPGTDARPDVRPAPTDIDPKTKTQRAVAVARAIRALEGRDIDAAFLGAKRLGRLGLLRAEAPLLKALRVHGDPDVRTAAAQALGRLRSAGAVPALLQALTDQDVMVRYAAETSLRQVTRFKPKATLRGATGHADRVRLQKVWRTWWGDNEEATRARLKQPKGV